MIYRIGHSAFGLAVAQLALALVPGHRAGSSLLSAALGMSGALAAAWGGERLGLYRTGNPAGFVMSGLGAVALLLVQGVMDY